jgi:endonuclease YncB( thermonuclease family)
MLKEILVLAALAFGQTPTVIDGDTVRIAGVSIRLTDYDSPELFSSKCPKEQALAWQARRELQAIVDFGRSWLTQNEFQARCRVRMRTMGVCAPRLRSMGSRLLPT